MNKYSITAAAISFSLKMWAGEPQRVDFGVEPNTGLAAAVRVGEVALVYTATMLPRKGQELVADGDAVRQAEQVLVNLDLALVLGGSSLGQVVKFNFSVAETEMLEPVGRVLSSRFSQSLKPAVTLVVSRQVSPGVLVSGDAVGVTGRSASAGAVVRLRSKDLHTEGKQSHAAILPAGPRIYFSGKTADAEAAAGAEKIMADAKALMDHVATVPSEIVQVSVMMKALHDARNLESALEKFFAPAALPPIAYVERNSGKAGIEIEMIAVGKPGNVRRSPQIEYMAVPPHWRASPSFSHIARVNRGGSIYVSGAYGKPGDDAAAQAAAIFARLEQLVRMAGGDFAHLAKAMYYVNGREAVAALDNLRPKVFPAGRPPAASRNPLRHIGGPGGSLVVDLIAIPVEK